VVYVLFRWIWSIISSKNKKKGGDNTPPRDSNTASPSNTVPKIIAEMKKDPICGTYIPENQAVISEINGTIHYFCSEECKLKFQELPK
jgi:YHS domain-containing protein